MPRLHRKRRRHWRWRFRPRMSWYQGALVTLTEDFQRGATAVSVPMAEGQWSYLYQPFPGGATKFKLCGGHERFYAPAPRFNIGSWVTNTCWRFHQMRRWWHHRHQRSASGKSGTTLPVTGSDVEEQHGKVHRQL